ncbi:MAG TPA: tripartite tricarboxylate transporter substrate-binding protein [candidate division Zixibacteria bacterium]|nr:tripartite tricarboxylate transporter substrate-binding protein [candidate division Zixibacteria bacterium]
MKVDSLCSVVVVFLASLYVSRAVASNHEYYRGKTVRVIVGLSAGGGFDVYARAVARHMGRYIPGNPSFIVDNMPGAGSMIAANHVYKAAKPDGLTLGHFVGSLFMQQLLGRPGAEFEATKYQFIGAPIPERTACALTRASGIGNLEQWLAAKAPVKLGATGSGPIVDVPKILKVALGLAVQLVLGFKGTSDIRLAAESGELAGACWSWDAIKSTWAKGLESGDVNIVLQALPKPHRDLPKVPLAIDHARNDEARRLIEVGIHDAADVARPFVMPPGTPKDRVQTMRAAFMATLRDPGFLAEAEKSKLDVDPVPGETLEKIVSALYKTSSVMLAKLKEVLN